MIGDNDLLEKYEECKQIVYKEDDEYRDRASKLIKKQEKEFIDLYGHRRRDAPYSVQQMNILKKVTDRFLITKKITNSTFDELSSYGLLSNLPQECAIALQIGSQPTEKKEVAFILTAIIEQFDKNILTSKPLQNRLGLLESITNGSQNFPQALRK